MLAVVLFPGYSILLSIHTRIRYYLLVVIVRVFIQYVCCPSSVNPIVTLDVAFQLYESYYLLFTDVSVD